MPWSVEMNAECGMHRSKSNLRRYCMANCDGISGAEKALLCTPSSISLCVYLVVMCII